MIILNGEGQMKTDFYRAGGGREQAVAVPLQDHNPVDGLDAGPQQQPAVGLAFGSVIQQLPWGVLMRPIQLALKLPQRT